MWNSNANNVCRMWNSTMNHFETADQYLKRNQQFSTETIKTRFYETLQLAAYDVSFSLLQFLSHKPKIAIIRQGSSVFELLIPIFLRQQTPIQFKVANQNIYEFLNHIDKETNFLLWSGENEITGEVIFSDSQCYEIHKILSEKKIFSIQIVHAQRGLNKIEILKNNFAILIESPGLFALPQTQIFFTDKLKAPTLIGAFQKNNFTPPADSLTLGPVDLKILSEFQYEKLFQPTINYLSDRKVFVFKNCSGQMMMQKLIEKKLITAAMIFAPSALPTWVLDTFKNWWADSEKTNLLLNLVVISNQAFQLNLNLESEISNIYKKIQVETSWVVS